MSLARQRIAITSLAAVMSKPLSRGMPSERPPNPMMMSRSARSFMSMTRFHVTCRGSSRDVVAVVQRVVDQRRQQVVRARDGVEVAVEVQVDVHHRQHFGSAAAGAAALHAEDRPEARLAQRRRAVHADFREALDQADGGGGLALACRRGRDRRDEHELAAIRPAADGRQRQLGLVVAVRFEHGGINADGARDVADGFHEAFPLVRAGRRAEFRPLLSVRGAESCTVRRHSGLRPLRIRAVPRARALVHERPGRP